MNIPALIFAVLVVGGILIMLGIWATKAEKERFNAMSPEERSNLIWGQLNPHLICPHCQTQGTVRSRLADRSIISQSKGEIGGILKTKTDIKTTSVVYATQHHCDKCNSTWDI